MLLIHLFTIVTYSNLIKARSVILSSFLSCSPVDRCIRTGSLYFGPVGRMVALCKIPALRAFMGLNGRSRMQDLQAVLLYKTRAIVICCVRYDASIPVASVPPGSLVRLRLVPSWFSLVVFLQFPPTARKHAHLVDWRF